VLSGEFAEIGYVISMSSKQKYCPTWIYDCVVADVCSQFLMDRRQIEAVSAIFATGLGREYVEISVDELSRAADEAIQFLVKVGENNAIDLLSNFSFFRFYNVSKTQKRNFRGMMSWGILADTKRSYSNVSTLKLLRAYYYEQRSGTNNIGCLDWRLENQPEVEFLRVLASRV
jgi:hypothetical protein